VSTNHDPKAPADTVQTRILTLLDDLPPESQALVEQFTRFLHEQARHGEPVGVRSDMPYLYPTVPLPPATLDALIGIMPPINGDALADSEALYEEI
jgi:hypothetical protein